MQPNLEEDEKDVEISFSPFDSLASHPSLLMVVVMLARIFLLLERLFLNKIK